MFVDLLCLIIRKSQPLTHTFASVNPQRVLFHTEVRPQIGPGESFEENEMGLWLVWSLSFDCGARRGGKDGASFLQSSRESPCLDQLRSAILGLVQLLGEQLDGVVELDHLAHKLSVGVVVARLTKSNSSKNIVFFQGLLFAHKLQ